MILRTVTNATDRDGVVDAVTRLVEGIDFADEELLRSALTEDVVFDLSGIDPSMHTFIPYEGRDTTVRTLLATVGHAMDTFHALANVRVHVEGSAVRLTCYLIGQHHRLGEGPSLEHQDSLLLGNRFESELVRDEEHPGEHVWRVRRHRITSRWSAGNASAAAIPS